MRPQDKMGEYLVNQNYLSQPVRGHMEFEEITKQIIGTAYTV